MHPSIIYLESSVFWPCLSPYSTAGA